MGMENTGTGRANADQNISPAEASGEKLDKALAEAFGDAGVKEPEPNKDAPLDEALADAFEESLEKFKAGETVRVMRSDGEIDDGWRVDVVEGGRVKVIKEKDGMVLTKEIPEEELAALNRKEVPPAGKDKAEQVEANAPEAREKADAPEMPAAETPEANKQEAPPPEGAPTTDEEIKIDASAKKDEAKAQKEKEEHGDFTIGRKVKGRGSQEADWTISDIKEGKYVLKQRGASYSISAEELLKLNPEGSETESKETRAPKDESIEGAIGEMSPKEREQAGRGFFYWNDILREYRGKFFGDIFDKASKIAGKDFEKTTGGRFLKGFAKTYRDEAARAEKARIKEKGSVGKLVGAAGLMGNALRYGRVIADFGYALPYRGYMGLAMFFGRAGEAAKHARFMNEEIQEQHRVESVDEAAEEAWKIYEEAKNKSEGKPVSRESLEEAYVADISENVIKRLAKNPPGSVGIGLLRRMVEKELQIRNKVPGGLSEQYLRDLDSLVTYTGTVDSVAYAARSAEKLSKGAALLLTVDTAYRGAKGVARILSKITDTFEHNPLPEFLSASSTTTTTTPERFFAGSSRSVEAAFLDEQSVEKSRELFGEERARFMSEIQEEIAKRDHKIRLLENIVELSRTESSSVVTGDAVRFQEELATLASERNDLASKFASIMTTGGAAPYEAPEILEQAPRETGGLSKTIKEGIATLEGERGKREGPHLLASKVIEKGESPIKALKFLYRENPELVAKYLGVESVNGVDIDRAITRRVVGEFLVECGNRESKKFDREASEILEKAITSWMQKHGGGRPDLTDPKILQQFMSHVSAKEFNHVLNDRVSNLVHPGDIIAIDSSGDYEIKAPAGAERAMQIEVEEGPRLGRLGEHQEITFGLEPNPFEGLKWDVVPQWDGTLVETLNLNKIFEGYQIKFGTQIFDRVVGYDIPGPDGRIDGELDQIVFYNDKTGDVHYIPRASGEIKKHFFDRIIAKLERGEILNLKSVGRGSILTSDQGTQYH